MMRFGLAQGVAALTLALGCGGVSVDQRDGARAGGKGGTGSAEGGTGDSGGTTGGTGNVGGTTGGSMIGGTGNVGGTTGGSVTGGTGNVGGSRVEPDAEACKLPFVTGPCDAAIFAFGFDTKKGHCDSFYYGGCEGNANRFDSMAACAATCGLGPLTGCPTSAPELGKACEPRSDTCTYKGLDRCLCQQTLDGFCLDAIEDCVSLRGELPPGADGACEGPDCTSEIVLPADITCACDGTWACKLAF